MQLIVKRVAIVPIAVLSIAGLVLVSACSGPGASADSASVADAVASSAGTKTPVPTSVPTLVSNVPFPLDPAPSPAAQGSTTGRSGENAGGPHREGDHEGGEGGDEGESGEHRSVQRIAVMVTGNGISLSSPTASAGLIEFDLSNQTAASVDVLISGNGVNGDTGLIAPGATVHLQGTLSPGSYTVALGSATATAGAADAVLQVQ